MKFIKVLSLFLVIFFLALVFCYAQEDPFEIALEKVGLTKQTLKFDYYDMSNFGGDEFVLPIFTLYHSNFFKVPYYTSVFKNSLANNSSSLKNLVMFGSLRVNEGVRRGLIGDPLEQDKKKADSTESLCHSITALFEKNQKNLTAEQIGQLENLAKDVPSEISQLVALLVYTSLDFSDWRKLAFQKAEKNFDLNKLFPRSLSLMNSDSDMVTAEFYDFLHYIDYQYLYTGAEDLASAVDFVADSLKKLNIEKKFSFNFDTPWGKIVIDKTGKTFYPQDIPYFIIIDLEGEDEYQAGGANSFYSYPVSIIIDAEGNDTYKSTDKTKPSFGAGVFGCGFLVDLKGDDIYDAVNLSQGCGLFGVGALLDFAGNDSYNSYTTSQGSAQFGIGILSDLSGNDTYNTFLCSQGFGYTKGCGILVDMKGDDQYVANDSRIDFPASQTKEHNDSMSQGVGFGRRADFTDGHSFAGGVGFLVDMEGNDQYSAGLFAQGCAYWYGLGVLCDNQGNDSYSGIWYVQGSGAHFGVGILNDSYGNDHYKATMNMAIGAGHDFSLGVLIDEEGNDTYDAPNLSLGGGNDNGIGIFWDKSGDDIYNVEAATTLGRANITAVRGGLRDSLLCLGLFLDTGGKDKYSKPFARNNSSWTQKGLNTKEPVEMEKGVGLDKELKPKKK